MRELINAICRWACPTCKHRNPPIRMSCRKCRRDRPLGA